jgi:hypothetical protein
MGLLKTAATVAVASSVHGRVQRRQQERWARQDAANAAPAPATPPPPTPPPPTPDVNEQLAQLERLGSLRTAGVLTDAEFELQKARILGG